MAIQAVERRTTIKRARELLLQMLDEVEKGKNWDKKVEVVKLITMFNLMVAKVSLMKPERRGKDVDAWEALRSGGSPIQDRRMKKLYNELKIEIAEEEQKMLEKDEEEEKNVTPDTEFN